LDQIFALRQILEKKWDCLILRKHTTLSKGGEKEKKNYTISWYHLEFRKKTIGKGVSHSAVTAHTIHFISSYLSGKKKLVQLVRICLSDPISRVRVGNNMSDSFEVRNGLKQGDALSPLLFLCVRICDSRNKKGQKGTNIEWLESTVRVRGCCRFIRE